MSRRYNRIHTFSMIENKGLSITRMMVYYLQAEKYIWFVDSDDSIMDGALEKLYITMLRQIKLICLHWSGMCF